MKRLGLLLLSTIEWVAETFRAKLLIMLLSLPLGGVLVYVLVRGDTPISAREIRLFAGIFMLATLVGNFAFLRLYNALVSNSTFLLALKKELRQYGVRLEKFTTSFAGSVRLLKVALRENKSATEENSGTIKMLIKVLRKES